MPSTNTPTSCDSCGHAGGRLAPQRSEDFDHLARTSGLNAVELAPSLLLCSGRLFDVDGPVECMRRATR